MNKPKFLDLVLVRNNDTDLWEFQIFTKIWKNRYVCMNDVSYEQCILFNVESMHSLGENDIPDSPFCSWFGDKVIFYDRKNKTWDFGVYYQDYKDGYKILSEKEGITEAMTIHKVNW